MAGISGITLIVYWPERDHLLDSIAIFALSAAVILSLVAEPIAALTYSRKGIPLKLITGLMGAAIGYTYFLLLILVLGCAFTGT